MISFGLAIAGLSIFFLAFAILIGSFTAVANLAFMALCYLARKPFRYVTQELTAKRKFLGLVIAGTTLGLVEEALWYFGHLIEKKPQPWVSLLDDFIRMFPAYLALFALLYFLIKIYPMSGKQAFVYGGIMGYIFYFAMEGAEIGFSPLLLLALWEINNFLLNGFLLWLPLYASGNLTEGQERTTVGHAWVCILLLVIVIIAISVSLLLQAATGYVPIKTGP